MLIAQPPKAVEPGECAPVVLHRGQLHLVRGQTRPEAQQTLHLLRLYRWRSLWHPIDRVRHNVGPLN